MTEKMVTEDSDCLQVFKQIAVASGPMRPPGAVMLKDHLIGCVASAIQRQDNATELISEVVGIPSKSSK